MNGSIRLINEAWVRHGDGSYASLWEMKEALNQGVYWFTSVFEEYLLVVLINSFIAGIFRHCFREHGHSAFQ